MKHLLFVVLVNKKETNDLLLKLSQQGFNGTVLSSTSLKHLIHEEEDEDAISFLSLAHISEKKYVHNTTIYFILEDDDLKIVQQSIRNITENFNVVKGGMFSTPIESYEGSF